MSPRLLGSLVILPTSPRVFLVILPPRSSTDLLMFFYRSPHDFLPPRTNLPNVILLERHAAEGEDFLSGISFHRLDYLGVSNHVRLRIMWGFELFGDLNFVQGAGFSSAVGFCESTSAIPRRSVLRHISDICK